ncbi:MAG: transporter substrate-binding domain-containing protein, partial [Emcibacteraceae bacterium]|nr:transporter substrate-binding domain-containing protein [Emcibacteraceae bacterium]
MRKIFAIFILFLISTSYAYCQDFNGKVDLSEDERAWLQENPVLKAPNQPTWAPIDFVVDGKPQGFSIDFLNLIAKNVGFEVEYVSDRNWSELLKALESEEIDIALSIIETTERKEYLNFTDPYLDMTVVYYGKTGSKKNNNINDLRSLRIGDVAGGVAATIYKNQYPELNIIEYGTSYDVLMAIVNDEIDVMPAINTVANYLIDINNIDDVIIIGDTFFPLTGIEGNINFAAIKKHPLLHSILVKGMASVSEKELYDLKVKWRMLPFLDENVVLTEEEKEWLTSNNEIVVASDITKEPIEFLDANGELSGYSADYLNLIAKRLGVTFEWSGSKNCQEAIEKINEKEADIVSFIMPTEDRKDTFTFTDIYHDVAHMVIARSENSMFGSLEALEGKTVAQVRNYAITNFIESDFPSVNIIYTSSISESLELVSSGEA